MKLLNKFSLSLLGLCLSACSITTISPIEQLQQSLIQEKSAEKKPNSEVKMGRDQIKQPATVLYLCDNHKVVRIQPSSHKKNSPITLVFNQMSYKLSPAVSSQGKKYSNIRWTWLEDFKGRAVLFDNRQKVMAVNCVRKGAER